MKIVKEHINEKFSKSGDPIKDMQIGLYTPKNFKTDNDLINYIMMVIYDIYDGEIPKYVFDHINKFDEKNITGPILPVDLYSAIVNKLDDIGHKLRGNHIVTFKYLGAVFNGYTWTQLIHKKLKELINENH